MGEQDWAPVQHAGPRLLPTGANVPCLVEACIDSVASAIAAERGGAGRVELCAALNDGGTTPSAGMTAAVVASVRIPVFVIVRPRGGDFVYSELELDVMRRDIDAARSSGAHGIVIGALRPNGDVAEGRTRSLVQAAGDLPVTFHRAFDLTPRHREALEAIHGAGCARVLTSGGAATAIDGAEVIAALVTQAGDRIHVLAGGGVREQHVAELVARTGVREVHARLSRVNLGDFNTPVAIPLRKGFPDDERAWEETDEARVRELVARANSN